MLTKYLIAFFLCLALSSCGKNISYQQEEEASLSTLQWLNQNYAIYKNPEAEEILQSIAKRLQNSFTHRTIKEKIVNNKIKKWEIYVIRANELNAFSLGAGRIVITTNLLGHLNSEAEFAAILAHEMSHQLLAHNQQALANRTNVHTFFSEEQELQADSLGIKIMDVAGYNLSYCSFPIQLYYLINKTDSASDPFIKKRLVNITSSIKNIQDSFSATGTTNTREFQKLRVLIVNP